MAEYAHPEALVTTDWVAEHGGDANVRLVEVDVDTSAYEQGHIAGAVTWNWQNQLQQNVARDIVSRDEMESLLSGSGIGPTRPSSCTATTTTGSPPGPSGSSATTDTRTCG